jgi:mono/diheme cytochrome c family protein
LIQRNATNSPLEKLRQNRTNGRLAMHAKRFARWSQPSEHSGSLQRQSTEGARAKRLMLRATAAAILLVATTAATYAQTDASVLRGKDIAEQACAGCHAIETNEARPYGAVLVPSFRTIAGGPRGTTERLKAIITTPPHPMPAIPLSLTEINDVAAYMSSLK